MRVFPDPTPCALTALLRCNSASNYLLGLTPIGMLPFAAGTMIGMGAWSLVFASIGGAGRSLLKSGVGLDVLLNGALNRGRDACDKDFLEL